MTEHTPTPWRVEENCLGTYPISAKQGPITVQPAKAFGEADAAFIVKAVNNHDPLVKSLARTRDAIRSVYHEIDNPAMPACLAAAWEVADLTLAAVSEAGEQS